MNNITRAVRPVRTFINTYIYVGTEVVTHTANDVLQSYLSVNSKVIIFLGIL